MYNKNNSLVHLASADVMEKEKSCLHEIIGLRRIHSQLEIGAFETKYKNAEKAKQALKALINTNLFHAGIIRTHGVDGSVEFPGFCVTEKEVGKQIVGDLLGYIAGDRTIGTFQTEHLYLSRPHLAEKEEALSFSMKKNK